VCTNFLEENTSSDVAGFCRAGDIFHFIPLPARSPRRETRAVRSAFVSASPGTYRERDVTSGSSLGELEVKIIIPEIKVIRSQRRQRKEQKEISEDSTGIINTVER